MCTENSANLIDFIIFFTIKNYHLYGCIGYNKTYAFYELRALIHPKIEAKTAKMHRFYQKTCASFGIKQFYKI